MEGLDKKYEELFSNYKESDYFEENTIAIDYVKNIYSENDEDRSYMLTGVRLISSNSESISKILKTIVSSCDRAVKTEVQPNGWQVFYLYKEIFQSLINRDRGFNFFRGQSHDYSLLPGIMRDGVAKSSISYFETIYHKMSYEFPDKIDYTEFNGLVSIIAREHDLSLLQHYGLKTALLDITKNPYIAMLFMLKEKIKDYKEPAFYLFKINEKEKTLFSEVRKNQINERILAQKGAFLNFEKALLKDEDIKPIPYIKIILQFNEDDYKALINSDILLYNILKHHYPSEKYKVQIEEYERIIEKFKGYLNSIDKSKEESLTYINNELTQKLEEYYYTKEDMFPDFENRIRYLSRNYNKYIKNDKEYTENNE